MNKEDLFNQYSKNLELVSDKIIDQDRIIKSYICPICLKLFTSWKDLTIEHIPPKSVGWKKRVLTCKSCNNTQGGQLDSQLPLVLNNKAFFKKKPNTSIDTTFHLAGYRSDGVTKISSSGELNFHFDSSRTSPKNNKLIKGLLVSNNSFAINAKLKLGNRGKAILSIIRSGYLWAFADLGYAFLFNPNLNSYRNMILRNDYNSFLKGAVIIGDFNKTFEGVNIITDDTYKSWLIIFEVITPHHSELVGVNLPGSNSNSNNKVTSFRQFINSSKSEKYNISNVETNGMLLDDNLSSIPYTCWLFNE